MTPPETFAGLVDKEILGRFQTERLEFDEALDQRIQRQPGLFRLFRHANEEARDEIRKVFLLVEHLCERHGLELPWVSVEDGLALTHDPDRYRRDRTIGRSECTRQIMDEDLRRLPEALQDFLDPTRRSGYDPDFGQHGSEGWETFALFARKFEDLQWEFRMLQPDAPDG